jgi:uncharacterized protein YggT (Ycf19 family)
MIEERRIIRTNREDFGYGKTAQEFREQKAVVRSYNIIWFLVGLIDVILGFRFVFEILGANTASRFTQLVYTLSYPFAQPFRSIFGVTNVAGSFFDWSLLLAMIVYLLVGYGLIQVLRIIKPVTTDGANHRVRTI